MVNTTYKSSENVINKLHLLKGKTKSKLYKNISSQYDEMKIRRRSASFQFEEDPFSKNVKGIGKSYHVVLLIMNFLQTKPKVENMKIIHYNLYCTVLKKNEKEVVNDESEYDFINFTDSIAPNHYIGMKKTM